MTEIEGLTPQIESLISILARRRNAIHRELTEISNLEALLYRAMISLNTGEPLPIQVEPDFERLAAALESADLRKVDIGGCKTHADRIRALARATSGIVRIGEVTAALWVKGVAKGRKANLRRSVLRVTMEELGGEKIGPGVYRVNV